MNAELQASRLAAFGASPPEIAELVAYNENPNDLDSLSPRTRLPLPDEPFVAFWEGVVEACRAAGAFPVLQRHLPQLRFPIREGISETAGYRAATRRGVPPAEIPEATGLELEQAGALEVVLHTSAAGRIPLLIARRRGDFVALLRALVGRNEPVAVAASQGAMMVAGYNNWSRLGELRQAWEARGDAERETASWAAELDRLRQRRDLFQDRFILLSDGAYSGLPASELGLDETSWRVASLVLRREHECAHYLTRRLFGSMRNHLLDELAADYAGLVAAVGRFQAALFLRCVGVEDLPRCRPGARLDLYRGKPPLSDGAFAVVQRLARAAAENLERFDARRAGAPASPEQIAVTVAAIASLRLDELAEPGADAVLSCVVERLRPRLLGGSQGTRTVLFDRHDLGHEPPTRRGDEGG